MAAVRERTKRLRLKTYSHLLGARRMPTEYEIATTDLLYYLKRGFEVQLPLGAWYEQHQQGSPLRCADWDRFRDPRETTYTRYTRLQQEKELFVDGLLESFESAGYDDRLAPGWLATLERVLPPLRYPLHGLHMLAAYVGHMAPAGRVAIAALLQAADEVRRVQRVAQRMAQLRRRRADFGGDAMSLWLGDPAWQPLREVVERLLVTYDFGEALVGLNLCLKPALDEVLGERFAARALGCGDYLLTEMLRSLGEDARWQRAWTRALFALAAEDGGNRQVVARWVESWRPRACRAAAALCALWDEEPAGAEKWLEARLASDRGDRA